MEHLNIFLAKKDTEEEGKFFLAVSGTTTSNS